jgi:glycosyltransferase involved in cell wall biosynthesis
MRFSVVVPFHNSERYITRCVEGLLTQAYPTDQYEILLVDNNARDASADIAARFPRVRLLAEGKRGAYAARNTGIALARGEIVAFTDADCVALPDWLSALDDAMAGDETQIAIGAHLFDSDSALLTMLAEYENAKKAYVFGRGKVAHYYGHTNNMAIRRALLQREGGFVETLRGADTIFVRRCAETHAAGAVRYQPRARVRHLEIDSYARYLQKVFIYGRSSRRFAAGVSAQPLTNGDRARIFWGLIRARRYSPAQSAVLAAVLLFGLLGWTAGRGWGRATRSRAEYTRAGGAAALWRRLPLIGARAAARGQTDREPG